MSDMISACYILYNIFLGQSMEEVAAFLALLREHGLNGIVVDGQDDYAVEFEDVVRYQHVKLLRKNNL